MLITFAAAVLSLSSVSAAVACRPQKFSTAQVINIRYAKFDMPQFVAAKLSHLLGDFVCLERAMFVCTEMLAASPQWSMLVLRTVLNAWTTSARMHDDENLPMYFWLRARA